MSKVLKEWADSAKDYPNLFRATWPDPMRLAEQIWDSEDEAGEHRSTARQIDRTISRALATGLHYDPKFRIKPRWALKGVREGYTINVRTLKSPTGPLEGVIRIDRGTVWGNTFKMGTEADRARVVEDYRVSLFHRVYNGVISLESLAALADKRLLCWCAPKLCHGDVLALAARWAADELEARK